MSGSGREQPDADFDLSCGVDHLVACRRPTVLSALSLVRVHGSPFTDYHSTFIVVRRRNRCCRHSFHSSSFGRSVVRSFGRSVVRSFGRPRWRRIRRIIRSLWRCRRAAVADFVVLRMLLSLPPLRASRGRPLRPQVRLRSLTAATLCVAGFCLKSSPPKPSTSPRSPHTRTSVHGLRARGRRGQQPLRRHQLQSSLLGSQSLSTRVLRAEPSTSDGRVAAATGTTSWTASSGKRRPWTSTKPFATGRRNGCRTRNGHRRCCNSSSTGQCSPRPLRSCRCSV